MKLADHNKALQLLAPTIAAQAIRGRGDRYLAPSGDTTGATDASALANLAGNGVKLVLGKGVFYLPAAGVVFDNLTDFTLDCGGATIKPAANASVSLLAFGATFVRMTSCARSKIVGGVFDGNSTTGNLVGMSGCTDSEVSDNRLTGANGLGHIVGGGNTRCRIVRNRIADGLGTSRGIWFGNYSSTEMNIDCRVSDNIVNDVNATGIVYSGVGGVIAGNVSNDTGGSGIIFGGANGYASSDVVIAGNTANGNTFHGLQVDVSYGTDADLVRGCTINGNICNRNAQTGIYLPNSANCMVSGNTCNDNVEAGIHADDRSRSVVINGNTCSDTRSGAGRTQKKGIRVFAQAVDNSGVSVVGNTCRNNAEEGIMALTAGGYKLSDLVISGNITLGNANRGIFVVEESAGDITRAVVSDNCAQGNGTADIRASLQDVWLQGNRYATQQDVQYLTFNNGDTTPNVYGRKAWRANNASATTISNFDGGVDGQELVVGAANGNTTIQHGSIQLKGATNATIPGDGYMTFMKWGTVWREVSRSF